MTQLLKYKSGKMTALSVIVFTATIVAMLASCDTAQLEIPEVQLTLRLSLPEAGEYARTRAITADEENAIDIEQLKVLVFKVEGTSELFAYETPQIQLQANRYTVTLKQSQAEEKYRLVVIANAGKQLPAIQENTPKDEVLRKITFSASGNWNTVDPSDYTPFPMWGESATAQSITSATTLGSITLIIYGNAEYIDGLRSTEAILEGIGNTRKSLHTILKKISAGQILYIAIGAYHAERPDRTTGAP